MPETSTARTRTSRRSAGGGCLEEAGSFCWTLHRGAQKSKLFWISFSCVLYFLTVDVVTALVALALVNDGLSPNAASASVVCVTCDIVRHSLQSCAGILLMCAVCTAIVAFAPWPTAPRLSAYATCVITLIAFLVPMVLGFLLHQDAFQDGIDRTYGDIRSSHSVAICRLQEKLHCSGWYVPCNGKVPPNVTQVACPTECGAFSNNQTAACRPIVHEEARSIGVSGASVSTWTVILMVKQMVFIAAYTHWYRREMRRSGLSPKAVPKLALRSGAPLTSSSSASSSAVVRSDGGGSAASGGAAAGAQRPSNVNTKRRPTQYSPLLGS